jgi:hypothetical protein
MQSVNTLRDLQQAVFLPLYDGRRKDCRLTSCTCTLVSPPDSDIQDVSHRILEEYHTNYDLAFVMGGGGGAAFSTARAVQQVFLSRCICYVQDAIYVFSCRVCGYALCVRFL